MLDDRILESKLNDKLNKVVSPQDKARLVTELNLLSNLLIDIYLDNKNV